MIWEKLLKQNFRTEQKNISINIPNGSAIQNLQKAF